MIRGHVEQRRAVEAQDQTLASRRDRAIEQLARKRLAHPDRCPRALRQAVRRPHPRAALHRRSHEGWLARRSRRAGAIPGETAISRATAASSSRCVTSARAEQRRSPQQTQFVCRLQRDSGHADHRHRPASGRSATGAPGGSGACGTNPAPARYCPTASSGTDRGSARQIARSAASTGGGAGCLRVTPRRRARPAG